MIVDVIKSEEKNIQCIVINLYGSIPELIANVRLYELPIQDNSIGSFFPDDDDLTNIQKINTIEMLDSIIKVCNESKERLKNKK